MNTPNNSDIRISRMTERHLAQVFDLARKSNLSFWSYEDFKAEIVREASVCLVAENQPDEVAGFLTSRLIMSDHCAELHNIAVKDIFKRIGIGQRLLEQLIKSCVISKLDHILLDVRESNRPAIRLYSKLGFSILATGKNFYNSPPENALTMIKYLNEQENK